jgi:transcriptional regulator with XRE-family HTH domain
MADATRRKKTVKKAGAGRKKAGSAPRKARSKASKAPGKKGAKRAAARKKRAAQADRSVIERFTGLAEGLTGDLAAGALRLAARAGAAPFHAILGEPANPSMAREAGASLKELRKLAGLTRRDLSDALDLRDQSLLKAVESGAATLSFELILRLAAILARHDPVPFIARYTRTYSPEVWRILEDWGVGRLPLHFEREREFINVYRRHDAARKLSDQGFEKVLDLTRATFEMALHFVAEFEEVEDEEVDLSA